MRKLQSNCPIDTVSKPQHPAFHSRRIARLAVMWLLAIVLPLQGSAAVIFGAMGPAHSHRIAAAPAPVLEDFRRWKPAVQPQQHVLTALGHFHAGNSLQRHRHDRSDSSVVPAAADVGDTDEAAAASAIAVLAPIPSLVAWLPPPSVAVEASRPLWPPLTGFIPRLDRPPRA